MVVVQQHPPFNRSVSFDSLGLGRPVHPAGHVLTKLHHSCLAKRIPGALNRVSAGIVFIKTSRAAHELSHVFPNITFIPNFSQAAGRRLAGGDCAQPEVPSLGLQLPPSTRGRTCLSSHPSPSGSYALFSFPQSKTYVFTLRFSVGLANQRMPRRRKLGKLAALVGGSPRSSK